MASEEAQLFGFVGDNQEIGTITPAGEHHEPLLGEFASTAISGNDITVWNRVEEGLAS